VNEDRVEHSQQPARGGGHAKEDRDVVPQAGRPRDQTSDIHAEGRDGRERNIDVARDQDDQHTQGQQTERDTALEQVEDIAQGPKRRVLDPDRDTEQHDQNQQNEFVRLE